MSIRLDLIAGGVNIDCGLVDFNQLVNSTSIDEACRQQLEIEGRLADLGECFRVSRLSDATSGADCVIGGDCTKVNCLGAGLLTGEITIEGNAGDALGRDMRGGKIEVHGNAGKFVGSPSRGRRSGMRGGMIAIRGDVGEFVGYRLRRGIIVADGRAGAGVGAEMMAGTLIVGQPANTHFAVGMRRGTVICTDSFDSSLQFPWLNGEVEFSAPCPINSVFGGLLVKRLQQQGLSSTWFHSLRDYNACWFRVLGDRSVRGVGEIWFQGGAEK